MLGQYSFASLLCRVGRWDESTWANDSPLPFLLFLPGRLLGPQLWVFESVSSHCRVGYRASQATPGRTPGVFSGTPPILSLALKARFDAAR